MPTLFIGNCDAQTSIVPKDPKKLAEQHFRSLRWANYLDAEDDILVAHLPYTPEYIEYRKHTFGFSPKVLAPKAPYPEKLAQALLKDEAFLDEIRSHLTSDFQLMASVNTPAIHELAKKLVLPLAGQSPQREKFDDKAFFIEHFPGKTPGGKLAHSRDEIREHAASIEGPLMLRQTHGASCMGNMHVTDRAQLEALGPEWDTPTLVEPFLDIKDSPCTLGYINDDGQAQALISGIQIFDPRTYMWTAPPNFDYTEMMQVATEYFQLIADQGARGWVDIDWARLQDDILIGIESNYRTTGWTAATRLFQKLHGHNPADYPKFLSCDTFPLEREWSLSELAEHLGPDVLITSPMIEGRVGLLTMKDFDTINLL